MFGLCILNQIIRLVCQLIIIGLEVPFREILAIICSTVIKNRIYCKYVFQSRQDVLFRGIPGIILENDTHTTQKKLSHCHVGEITTSLLKGEQLLCTTWTLFLA